MRIGTFLTSLIILISILVTCGRYDSNSPMGGGTNVRYEPIPGPAGSAGPVGSTGPSGEEGGRGQTGPTGSSGQAGSPGSDGRDGRDGTPGQDGSAGSTGPAGSSGPTGVSGATGPAGSQGISGSVGPTGSPGASCSVTRYSNGATISCTDGTSVVVLDGVDGAPGSPGPTGSTGVDGSPGPAGSSASPTSYTVVEIVDPCGQQTQFDEVLFRLENNQLVAHYASGSNQFLTIVGPGNYVTTDGTHCYFTVNSDLSISNEHN